MNIKGYTPEEQLLSKLEHDPEFAEEYARKFAAQRSFDDRRDLCILDTDTVETPIGRSTYWEGQNGWGFGIKFFAWVILTFTILIGLTSIFGVGFFPPILAFSGVLSALLLRLFLRRMGQ